MTNTPENKLNKHKELRESWQKLHTTICEIAYVLGWSDDEVAHLAESMACQAGDGRAVIETLKEKLKIS